MTEDVIEKWTWYPTKIESLKVWRDTKILCCNISHEIKNTHFSIQRLPPYFCRRGPGRWKDQSEVTSRKLAAMQTGCKNIVESGNHQQILESDALALEFKNLIKSLTRDIFEDLWKNGGWKTDQTSVQDGASPNTMVNTDKKCIRCNDQFVGKCY